MGVYMGIFNFFIVVPEIIASFAFGPVIRAVFGQDNPNSPMYVVMAGGVFLTLAAISVLLDLSARLERCCRVELREPNHGTTEDLKKLIREAHLKSFSFGPFNK